jgi:ferredoxin-NADP reductase
MMKISDKDFKRFYTLSSTPTQKYFCEISVRRVEGGVVSNSLHNNIKKGDFLDSDAPSGKFIFTGHEADSVLMVGGGVGITPLMGVLRYLIDTCWDGEIYFLYACRTLKEFIFREELEYLYKRHPHLYVHCFISELKRKLEYAQKSRINKDDIARFVPAITSRRICMCGSKGFMKGVSGMLLELGVPKENIHSEAFASGGAAGKALTMEEADVKDAPTVTFQKSKKNAPIPKDAAVLDVADHIGVQIDNTCRVGICGLCKVKLLSGEVEMEVQEALTDEDKEDGIILACQGKCKKDITVDA